MNLRSLTRIFAFFALLYSQTVMAIEEPSFQVLATEGPFQVRQYAPMLIAEVVVEGDMDEASNKGFRLIADFIFGNNSASSVEQKSKIAMTAPVTVEPQPLKIPMTAPVTVEPQASGAPAAPFAANQWRVSFVMPAKFNLSNIPKPINSAVVLREIPGKVFVVHTYSGFNFMSKVETKIQETMRWSERRSLKMIGTPQLARYDPPWTLPMFRRNEILIEVSQP